MIAVIGAGRASPEDRERAREVGRTIARAGAVLVCGGLGGVMEAAAEGAKEEGGLTIGILPGTEAASANPHIEIAIPTGLGLARNVIVVSAARAVVAVGGALGTLSEIAIALQKGIPVVCLGSWDLDEERARGAPLHRAETPDEAVALALRLAGGSD